jgi:hypothetical protein
MAYRGIDDSDAVVRGIGEIATTGRVDTTPEVPFRLDEPRQRLVDRRGVYDTDGLLGSIGKLQWLGHVD